jgi:hypothetical protein
MLKELERGNALRKVESCRKGIGEQNWCWQSKVREIDATQTLYRITYTYLVYSTKMIASLWCIGQSANRWRRWCSSENYMSSKITNSHVLKLANMMWDKAPICLDFPANVDRFLIPTVGTWEQLALNSPPDFWRTGGPWNIGFAIFFVRHSCPTEPCHTCPSDQMPLIEERTC